MDFKSKHTDDYRCIIQQLRNIREEKRITQNELANLLGCNQTIISKIETFERRLDIIELRIICKKLNVDFVDFVTNIDKRLSND